jgi:hypothetical protein
MGPTVPESARLTEAQRAVYGHCDDIEDFGP